MKKTKLLVMTAVVVLGIGTAVRAELPPSSIIIGNQAYSIGYLQNNSDIVNEQVMNNLNNIYYVDSAGKAKDIFTGAEISESQLVNNIGTTLTSYNDSGVATKYTADLDNKFQLPSNNNNYQSYIVVDATYSTVTTNVNVVYVKIRNIVGVKDASYYTVGSSSTATGNLISISNQATFFSLGSTDIKPITIYDSDKVAIYSGNLQINFSSTGSGTDTEMVGLLAYPNVDQTALNQPGNLNGNITNTGLASIDYNEKWIYYINTGDKNKLYKKSVDGLDNYPISDDSVGYINVVGNWVYYVNYSDDGKIYKVKIDGTGRQLVSSDVASGMCVYADNIFYSNHSDGGKIYVINSSGKMKLTNDAADDINVIGNSSGAVIYYSNASSGKKLYKATYNSASSSVSVQKVTDVAANYINAVSQSIVYYTSSDSKLYRLSGTTSSPVKIMTNVIKGKTGNTSTTSTEEKLSVICVDSQGNIYYKSNVDNGKLYKTDSNYNGYKLVDSSVDFINIIDSSDGKPSSNTNNGYVYYMKSNKLYRIPIDTDGTAAVESISKPKTSLKIKSIEEIPTISTDDINSFNFPERVSALMNDGTIQELVVNWDKSSEKFSKGVYTYTGVVLGYGNKVTLKVSITTSIPTVGDVVVKNDAGNKDTVTVSNLNPGDTASVYMSTDQTKATKTATANSSGVASITGLSLNADGGTLYVTATTSGKAESAKLPVSYSAEAPVNFSIDAENNKITGLKKNQNYTIYMYDASITNDANVDWDGSDATGTKTDPVKISVTSDGNGTVTLSGTNAFESIISTTNGGKDMIFRIKQNGGTSSTDSLLSSAVTVSKAKVPDYVTIDYTSGVINGTDNTMQYTYSNPSDPGFDSSKWIDCNSGMTPVSINMYLEVWVRVKPNGATLSSKSKGLSLFAPPTVTGIVEGKMYSGDNKPVPTWNVTDGVSARIAVYNPNEQDDDQWTTVSGFGSLTNGATLNVTDTAFNADTTYAFILTQIKSANGKTGKAKVIIKFKVNSTKPANVDITMKESKGISSSDALGVYYAATPEWTSFAGTYDTVSLYRINTPDPLPTYSDIDDYIADFTGAATIGFVKGNTVSQAGYYMLEVVTTNSQNGAKSTTDKFFVVNREDVMPVSLVIADGSPFMNGATYNEIAIKPILGTGTQYSTNRTSWGDWNSVTTTLPSTLPSIQSIGGVYVRDSSGKKESFVSAQIMGQSGAYVPYVFGQNISVNSLYNLSIKTTSSLNGAYKTNQYEFTVDHDGAIVTAPHVTLQVNADGKFVLGDATPGEDMTLMQYSVDGGTAWNSISSSSSYIIPDTIAKNINASNGVRVKVKAYGSYPESQQQLITVQKKDTPKDIGFKFNTATDPGTYENDIKANFILGTHTNITDISSCEYSSDGGNTWVAIADVNIDDNAAELNTLMNNLIQNNKDILVRQKASGDSGSGGVSIASDYISMGVWKPSVPSGITVDTTDESAYKLVSSDINVLRSDLEYSYDGGNTWYNGDSTFNSSNLSAEKDLLVRVKASGVKMPSSNMTITVPEAPSGVTFSFDGTSAGKLVGISTLMEYSINGGANYNDFPTGTTSTFDLVSAIKADPSLGSITAGNDIKVRVKATSTAPRGDAYKLGILDGPTTPLSVTAVPDITVITNYKLIGANASTMELSLDGGTTWRAITAAEAAGTDPIDCSGGAILKVRVKATGLTLPGVPTDQLNP